MVVKTLQVFYGADCLPYKDIQRTVHYPIVEPAFQGASQVNEIKFYVDDMGGQDAQWLVVAKLPNGKIGSKLLTTSSDENGTYALLTLSSWFTQAKGDLYLSLRGYDGGAEIEYDSDTGLYTISGNPIIQSTGAIKITIRYSTPLEGDDEIGEITIQELLGVVTTKLDKDSEKYVKVVSSVTAINDSTNADYLNVGDIVFAIASNQLIKLSGEYPSFTYDSVPLYLESASIDILDIGEELNITSFTYIYDETLDQTLPSYISSIAVLQTGNQTISGQKTFTDEYGVIVGSSSKTAYRNGYITLITAGGVETDYEIPSGGGTFATQSYVQQEIADALVSAYIVQGSASVSYLNNTFEKTQTHNGYVYNMTDSGTLTNSDSTTISVQQGDNVVFVWNNGSWYFDDLVGIVDLSGYVQKTQTIAGIALSGNISAQDLTDALIYATTSDITSIMED